MGSPQPCYILLFNLSCKITEAECDHQKIKDEKSYKDILSIIQKFQCCTFWISVGFIPIEYLGGLGSILQFSTEDLIKTQWNFSVKYLVSFHNLVDLTEFSALIFFFLLFDSIPTVFSLDNSYSCWVFRYSASGLNVIEFSVYKLKSKLRKFVCRPCGWQRKRWAKF